MPFIYKKTLLVRLSLFVMEANRFQEFRKFLCSFKMQHHSSHALWHCAVVSLRQLCSRLFFSKFVLMNCWTNDLMENPCLP